MENKEVAKEIQLAIESGDAERVAALIGSDKDRLNMKTRISGTWLHVAASFGRLEIVKRLIEMGADVNAYGGLEDSTPLQQAAADGHNEVARYLLSHGARLDVSIPDRNPLFAAIIGGHKEMAELLIDAGIDTTVSYSGRSFKNRTALSFARDRGQSEIAQLLMSSGGQTPGPAQEGQTDHVSSEGVLIKKRSRRKRPGPSGNDSAHREIIDHMASHFGPVQDLGLEEILPVTGIRINVIPPHEDDDDELILFTTGMSDHPQAVPRGEDAYRYTELFIRLPANWKLDRDSLREPDNFWPIEWLKNIASYPHDKNTWLGGQFTIISNGEPPAPLAPNTRLSCILLLCETEELNPIRCRDGREILLYSLVPLYRQERDLERAQGLEALLGRLAAKHVSMVIDPRRKNAAP